MEKISGLSTKIFLERTYFLDGRIFCLQCRKCFRREIDFVVNSGGKRTYIQSAYAMPTDEKEEELRPFTLIGDSFPKIVVRKDIGKRWYDDNGILNINVIDFLLDKELI